ncbi:MAG: glycerophosphodiester phosphodiesterase [Blastocatellia bacterium]|nr:glycerophosphodiester phosphodiesterase [Blastocatellia bacterium]
MKMLKTLTLLFIAMMLLFIAVPAQYKQKTLVAHRGASAYAPEHTLEAYRLALQQGADYVEQDLQITKDGVLVCLHDLTLERTTNVEEVFPDRFKLENGNKRWYVSDFMLAEIKQLDAGSWFDKKFAGAKVPTWQEAIDLVRGKAGLYPETKGPEVYGSRGFDMEKLVLAQLRKNKLPDKKTPVLIQSFSPESLRKMKVELKTKVPLVLLISPPQREWLTAEGLQKAKSFAVGIGPAKSLVDGKPELVKLAHDTGLSVTPYTSNEKTKGRFASAREEMQYFLYTLGVDALFTDNPDQFPRK